MACKLVPGAVKKKKKRSDSLFTYIDETEKRVQYYCLFFLPMVNKRRPCIQSTHLAAPSFYRKQAMHTAGEKRKKRALTRGKTHMQ